MSTTPTVSLLSDDDGYLFNEGSHFRLYDKLGAHIVNQGEMTGSYFAVWAPRRRAGFRHRRLQRLEPRQSPSNTKEADRHLGRIFSGRRQGHTLQVPHRVALSRLSRRQGRSVFDFQ